MRAGLAELLSRFGHEVVASVAAGEELVAAVRATEVDIVITDVRMPPGYGDEGIRAALTLRAESPALPIVVLSQYVEQTYASELLDSGDGKAVGYLLKDRVGDVEEFAADIGRIAEGGTVIDPEVVRQLLSHRKDPLHRLTARELEVLALMAEGRSNAAIARGLVVSDAAVSKHIASIFTKLDLAQAEDDHRRVRAVLAYLRAR